MLSTRKWLEENEVGTASGSFVERTQKLRCDDSYLLP